MSPLDRIRLRGVGRAEWGYRAALVGGFAATQGAYALAGIRFRSDTIDFFAQYLDPPLLQHRLLESLFYLHAQPPLLNLLTGLALKLAPEQPGGLLHACFLLVGFGACGWMAGILRRLGLPRPAAATLALAYAATPPFPIYEHWYFYPHLAQALLLLAGYCFARSGGRPDRWLAGGFWALAALVGLRSLFHPLYLGLAAAAAVALAAPGTRGRVLLHAAGPAAAVLLLALKNLLVFGFFGTSSWGGHSLHLVIAQGLDRRAHVEMVERGELSALSLRQEFSPPEVYLELLRPERGDRGIPALDQTRKSRLSGSPVNYNHWVYPLASELYLRDALRILRARPQAYARAAGFTMRRFAEPVTQDRFLRPIRESVRGAAEAAEAVERSAFYRLLVLAAILYGAWAVGRGATPPRERLVLAFLLGSVLWVTALGILVADGENNRYRYQMMGLVWILGVHGAGRLAGRLGRGRG